MLQMLEHKKFKDCELSKIVSKLDVKNICVFFTRRSGFCSTAEDSPEISKFFGADEIVPSGDNVAGMCSNVTPL